ncbi:MAG: FIST C-terminal domain-containing protein [Gemmatimonadota bacterium]
MRPLIDIALSTDGSTVNDLIRLIRQALDRGAQSLLLLSCDENGLEAAAIDPTLRSLEVPVFGGCFPTLLHGRSYLDRGFVVAGLSEPVEVAVYSEVSSLDPLGGMPILFPPALAESRGFVVLVDGLSSTIDHLVGEVYDQVGPDRAVLGGGAGSLSFQQRPCLFTNSGLVQDALQVVGFRRPFQTSVRHGWEKLAGPFLVTESDGNVIHSLNYRPAFELYSEVVQPYSTARFEDTDFFEIAKTFPFGLEKLDEALLVRDPIIAEDGKLVCVGHVPENAMIYVLRGDPAALKRAAGEAARAACPSGDCSRDVLVFDCISRKLFLDGGFAEELGAIREPFSGEANLVGALSLGEIANSEGGSVQFHNKTCVVGAYSSTAS